jgi:hypothetical protein
MKIIGKSFLKFKPEQINDFIKWIDMFPTSGKAPSGLKKDFESIKHLKQMANNYKEYGLVSGNISATFSWWKEDDIDRIVDAFFNTKTERIDNFNIGNLFFINDSSMAGVRFKETAIKIAKFLQRFDGFHKKSLVGKLEIHFKSSKFLRSKAKYVSNKDQIWIKEGNSRDVDTENYASLLYIIAHELGHRFEQKSNVPSSFKDEDFYTTKYSKTDSMAGSESFAEIFAISFFGQSKYPQFSDQIEKFNNLMK